MTVDQAPRPIPPPRDRAAGTSGDREWRQFQVLSRDAAKRLISAALFARDSDPFGFALWMLALLSTLPSFYAVHQLIGYATLRFASPAVIERTLIGDRLFFVTYAMAAASLLASLLWDALFPDRAEQEMLGVLPVRLRTAAAARFAAALHIGIVSALAINGPAAVIFMFAAASHLGLWSAHLLLAGHLLSTLLASGSVFLLLLAARGVLAVTFGARVGSWMSLLLQLVAIVVLVELFFFLPSLLDASARTMLLQDGNAGLPPVWFASLFSQLTGDFRPAFAAPARLALLTPATLLVVVIPLYLLSGARVGRRLLETQERHRPGRLVGWMNTLATVTGLSPRVRALFIFAVASLSRSRQHLLILTSYLSLAIALIGFRVFILGLHRPPTRDGRPSPLAYDAGTVLTPEPAAGLLAMPLILLFFVVFGLRASLRLPTDAGANWPFRLHPPPASDCARASWWWMVVLGLAPVIMLTLASAALLWPWRSALAAVCVTTASGLLLIEIALRGEINVPFACEHAPSADTVKWKWIAFLVGLTAFAFLLSPIEGWAVQSAHRTAVYVSIMFLATVALRIEQSRVHERAEVSFDAVSADDAAVLNLSEALP